MLKQTDQFYASQQEPNKSCFLALRALLLQIDSDITETVKYGMPCFLYKKAIVAYLWKDKKTEEPYILFAEGRKLNHPQLESGTRARMKTFTVNPAEDLPLPLLKNILKEAIAIAKTGSK